MRERGIIFSGQMVKALLLGRKTKTRRLLKLPPGFAADQISWTSTRLIDGARTYTVRKDGAAQMGREIACPHGSPGDRLWVRETWTAWEDPRTGADYIHFQADDEKLLIPDTRAAADFVIGRFGRWRPGIHLPGWASRIQLQVSDVRAEPLQRISEQEARAEGVSPGLAGPTYLDAFRQTWKVLHGEESWRANPWVWVVGFEVVEIKKGAL